MKRIISLAAIIVLTSGCATTYQQKGFTGGFTETQLSQDTYRVTFEGNAKTSKDRATDFVLLRSAELTKKSGYSYFVIVDADNSVTHSTYTTPTQTVTTGSVYGNQYGVYGQANSQTYGGQTYILSKPRTSNTIVMLHNKRANQFTYDANFIIRSLSQKYGLDIPVSSVSRPSTTPARSNTDICQSPSYSNSEMCNIFKQPNSMVANDVAACALYMRGTKDSRLYDLIEEGQKTITDYEIDQAIEAEKAHFDRIGVESYVERAIQSCETLGYDM